MKRSLVRRCMGFCFPRLLFVYFCAQVRAFSEILHGFLGGAGAVFVHRLVGFLFSEVDFYYFCAQVCGFMKFLLVFDSVWCAGAWVFYIFLRFDVTFMRRCMGF